MQSKIRILKSSDSMYWYTRYIGRDFPVVREESDRYWCREPNEWRCLNFVMKIDCKEIHSISDNESEVV